MDNNLVDNKLCDDKKIINALKKLNDEELNIILDSNFIDYVSSLDKNTINSIFRNASAMMQNKLWQNDIIQRILILGTKDINNFKCENQTIRNIENLNKIIKSQSVKKQIYQNNYFLNIVIYSSNIENRFFRSYDIKKVFENIVSSSIFNSLDLNNQLRIIEKLNCYTREILLPNDFRKKYNNIEKVLFESDIDKIDGNILSQLNEEELFFLDYLNKSNSNNNAIKKYIIENIKKQDKTFDEFFIEIKKRDDFIDGKIKYNYKYKNYFNKISLEEKVYHILLHENEDEIIKEKLLKYLICRTLKNSSVTPETMYDTLKRNLNNNLLSYKDIKFLTNYYNEATKDLLLTFYLRFNIVLPSASYFYGMTLEQLSKVNVKHINKLSKFLEDKTQDELSVIYQLCIKMYFIFGYERSIEILSGKFGQYNRTFLDNVAKTDVSRIKMEAEGKKYLPVIDKRFINFMFETPKNNHFIKMFNDKNSELYKTWYYLYNNYDQILETCHNQITLAKLITILETEKYDVDRKIITPDNYLLDNNSFLENIILGNKTHHYNNEVLSTIVDIYSQMKKRVESSIPYIKGTVPNGYNYEVMKLDDPQIFELGYKANCCIRTLDIAHNHLLHAALCRNGRILIIYDKLGDIAAFCPLKRNGNVLITNSIECVDKKIEINGHFITDAFKEAIEKIVKETKQSNEPINLVCIGEESYLKPNTVPYPNGYPIPTIFEKNDELYKDTDNYHKKLEIVYKDNNFNFKNIKSKNPDVSYMDPRDEVKYIDFYNLMDRENREMVIKLINSINYTLNKTNYVPIDCYDIKDVYFSKDWYISNTIKGIFGEYLENDYRAKEEFEYYMNKLNKENYQKVLKK